MKVEVAVLGSRPFKSTLSVDVKQHFNNSNNSGYSAEGTSVLCPSLGVKVSRVSVSE